MGFNDELSGLVADVAGRVDRWTAHQAWTFEPGSPASVEVANTDTRLNGAPWGERPVRTTYALAQMATKLAAEFSRCAAVLIALDRPAPGIETETRSALEAGSVAWWLLQPGLTARQRVCRMQLLRRNNAREYARSIAEVGEDPAVAGRETIARIEAECSDLGLSPFTQSGDVLEGEVRLKYTPRVKALTDELGNVGAYSIYSASAHSELAGIWRLYAQTGATLPDRQPLISPAANHELSHAAGSTALKALMGPMERITDLFGWSGTAQGNEITETIDYINGEIKRLHP
jgi:hypothetical protein